MPHSYKGYFYDQEDIQNGLEYLNDYLVAMMEQRFAWGSDGEAIALLHILRSWSGTIGWYTQWTAHPYTYDPYYSVPLPFSVREALFDFIKAYLSHCTSSTKEAQDRQHDFSALFRCLDEGKDTKEAYLRVEDYDYTHEITCIKNLFAVVHHTSPAPKEDDYFPVGRYKRLFYELRRLSQLGRALAKEPILTKSGLLEPIPGTPRTYADMHNEIANTLANLEKIYSEHTARCKIGAAEHIIKPTYLRIDTTTPEVRARITSVRDMAQQAYCRPRAAVESEIWERHQQLKQVERRQEPPPLHEQSEITEETRVEPPQHMPQPDIPEIRRRKRLDE